MKRTIQFRYKTRSR